MECKSKIHCYIVAIFVGANVNELNLTKSKRAVKRLRVYVCMYGSAIFAGLVMH